MDLPEHAQPLGAADRDGYARRGLALAAAALGAAAALLVGFLLVRLLFEGYSKTSDDILYARSLWGLAHGEGYNPARELHALLIHFNLILYVLAPFVYVAPAAKVLAWAQAAALGATVGLVGWGFGRQWQLHRPNKASLTPWVGLGAGLLALASPAVHNPFLCGLHPDVLGLPFMTACVFRVVLRRGLDWRAVALMAPALLVREDYFLYLASLAIFAPHDGPGVFSKHTRTACVVVGSVVFAGYYVLTQTHDNAGLQYGNMILKHIAPGQQEDAFGDYAVGKVMLLGSFVACMGGLWWRQWRWVLVGFPALMLNLLNQNLPMMQVELQYSALFSWALLGASFAGWRAWLEAPKPAAPWGWAVVGMAGFLLLGTLPGGRLFDWEAFHWEPRGWGIARDDLPPARQDAFHATLSHIPPSDGLVVTAFMGARLADRPWIAYEWYFDGTARQPDPWLQTAVLSLPAGVNLARSHGFAMLGMEDEYLLLSRSEATIQRFQGDEERHKAINAQQCPAPPLRWPEAGLALCTVRLDEQGRQFFVFLVEDGARAKPVEVMALRAGSTTPAPLESFHNARDLRGLPPGTLTLLYDAGRVKAEGLLVLYGGEPLVPRSSAGPLPGPAVPLR